MLQRGGLGFAALTLLALGIVGCSAGENKDEVLVYESDHPGDRSEPFDDDGWEDAPSGSDDDANRDIVEADVIQVRDDRLYAVSQSSGLAIIDLSNDRLRLLGRFRRLVGATPFELYLRGDIAFAMYTNWSEKVRDEETGADRWITTSRLLALDVSDPTNVREMARFDVPGEVSDSRIVGNILYLVTYQDASCWQCKARPTTVVASFDVSDPTSIRKVDELAFEATQMHDGWSRRSVTVAPNRMYVAGPEWTYQKDQSSTIQVIDIADPDGDLVPGASVKVAGMISSRWQMDEHDGVLRVVSQSPDGWNPQSPPRVETFRVVSSDDLQPLGSLDLKLPRPEELKSVRFDGTRAYAITFERTDPLFTIDLSNPEVPEQKGELEIPGWVEHMEPRGDRLYGLGFEEGNLEGSLHVSIFDVSDLSKPTMLDRVNFGPTWGGTYVADKDRLHKTFQILPDEGLILVPFSSYGGWRLCEGRAGGVQLIDFDGDRLRKRGLARAHLARRAFLHKERLITLGDERADLFDIANRDEPKLLSTTRFARHVSKLLPMDDDFVRVVSSGGTASLQVVSKGDVNADEPLASVELDLVSLADNHNCASYDFGRARVFASEGWVYVLVPSATSSRGRTLVYVVDFSESKPPKIVHKGEYPFRFAGWDESGESWGSALIQTGAYAVQAESTVAVLETFSRYSDDAGRGILHVLDFSNPSAPGHTSIALANAEGRTGLQLHGAELFMGRWNRAPENPSRVRFYVDRVRLAPEGPVALPSVNVPGSLLAFDGESGRLLTVDYKSEIRNDSRWDECREGWFNQFDGTCRIVHRTLELLTLEGAGAVRIDSVPIEDGVRFVQAMLGQDRVFLVEGALWDGYCAYKTCDTSGPMRLRVVSGMREGRIRITPVENTLLHFDDAVASALPLGQRLVFSSTTKARASVIDARDLGRISATPIGDAWGYAQHMLVRDGYVYFAFGAGDIRSARLPD